MQYVRSILCTVFVFLVIAGISYADSGKPKSDVRIFSAEVLKVLALPENEIDVGLAALVFAKASLSRNKRFSLFGKNRFTC